MSVSVNKNSYIPDYDSFQIFGKYKLPFIGLLVFIILAFIVIFSMFNKNSNVGANTSVLILEIILWVTLVIIIVLNAKWLNDKHYSFTTEISNIFNEKITQMDIRSESESDVSNCQSKEGEVFNIPDNKYTYSDATDICKKLNSRLATYDEVEDAYKNGANWCTYGWSDEQMALFPIQKSVYNNLKQIIGHKHDCGRPGINER